VKLNYFIAKDYPNFGDELNPYIFNHLFSSIFNSPKYNYVNFYGIGSIIDSRISEDSDAIIFGTGIRDIARNYNTLNWDIRFTRGPITSNVLGFREPKYIADAAYCMLCDDYFLPKSIEKKYDYSLIPHYRQMDKLDWNLIGKITGINIIDPRDSVQNILNKIAETKLMLCIAMHGAIVSDIVRTPWHRIKMDAIGSESSFLSDLKWLDFTSSMNLKTSYTHIKNYHLPIRYYSPKYWTFYIELIRRISEAKKTNQYQLTSDNDIKKIKEKLQIEIDTFRTDYYL